MKNFANYDAYLEAVSRKSNWATVSLAAAAEVAGVTPHTIKNWLRDKKLKGVKVGGDTLVRVDDLHKITSQKRSRRDEMAEKVKEYLVELLKEGKTHIFYGELMAKFDYNVQRSPDRNEFGIIAGKVSCLSFVQMEQALGAGKGALLSSMIWRKDTEFVGEGYWELFHEDYGYDFDIKRPTEDNAELFISDQIERCKNFYA